MTPAAPCAAPRPGEKPLHPYPSLARREELRHLTLSAEDLGRVHEAVTLPRLQADLSDDVDPFDLEVTR